MPVFQRLATQLVAEVPVTTLQDLLGRQLDDGQIIGGMLCGGGCRPWNGQNNGGLCGFNCRPSLTVQVQGLVDLDGVLGVTSEELAEVRQDLPKLRRAVTDKIDMHLTELNNLDKPAVQRLAIRAVDEIPIARLQLLLASEPEDLPAFNGYVCGGNCSGQHGTICGSGCNPRQDAAGVVDRDGRLGLTEKDLSDIRYDLPKLRQAVVEQVDVHLARLR